MAIIQNIPSDLKRSWLNVARRLQSVATLSQSTSGIITIRILVKDGEAKVWTKPTLQIIEPASSDFGSVVEALLGEKVEKQDKNDE